MNLEWEQNWLEQFDNRLEELMANYPETFEYEDLNFGVRIDNDREKLRRWFTTFENADPDKSKHYFNATRYHGDRSGGCLEWTWEDLIILERSLWDTAALMRQLRLQAPIELEFS
jgi:hypothetical protein